MLAPEIFALLASKPFAAASSVAPVLIAAAVCTALSRFARFGSLAEGKTSNVYKAATISALAMTLLLFALTPRFGPMGAAVAVLSAAAIRVLVEDRLARRLVNLALPWRDFLLIASVGAAVVVVCLQLGPVSVLHALIKLSVLAALAAGIWWSPYLGHGERQLALTIVRMRRLDQPL